MKRKCEKGMSKKSSTSSGPGRLVVSPGSSSGCVASIMNWAGPAFGAMIGLAIACLIDSTSKTNKAMAPAKLLPSSLPLDFRGYLSCKSHCHQASSNQVYRDLAQSHSALFHQLGRNEEEWPSFIEEVCVWHCGQEVTSGYRQLGSQYASVDQLPSIRKYLECADSCQDELSSIVKSASIDPVAATQVLKKCGVVHIPLGRVGKGSSSVTLIESMSKAYQDLRSGSRGLELRDSLLDLDHLREGREEFWVPYETPFSSFYLLLENSDAGEIIGRYFGNHSPAVIDHVNIINAPHSGSAQRQPLHRDDSERSSRHLEFHVPLWLGGALPVSMGPPRFCPCIHEYYALTDPVSEALVDYMISREKCLDFNNTHWILNAEESESLQLWGTLYNSQVYHQGLENISPHDRPVLVVAVSESTVAVQERGYVDSIENMSRTLFEAVTRFRNVDLGKAQSYSDIISGVEI